MPLSWNEIRDRAISFVREWEHETSEHAEAKSFWDAFFRVFGLERRRVAQFEARVSLVRNNGKTATGYVDLFWKGRLLVEHKSRGHDLTRAYTQAIDYFDGIDEADLPRYILVSDFNRFRLDDLDTGQRHDFALSELPGHLRLFGFIAGYESRQIRPQDPINIRAARKMARLHDQLKTSGYVGHDLEVLLVRLLFCFFADDTGIFEPVQAFSDWIENRTAPDGSDLGPKLSQFFQILNTPTERRQKLLDEDLAAFPYVNGKLFEERLSIPEFDSGLRAELLEAAGLEWSLISPAIFGALFQEVMDERPQARRSLGAHYTSEENILKVLEPLFLDDLKSELESARGNAAKLFDLQKRLRGLRFLDPACGCGNFLVVAYRELRELELEILRQARESKAIDVFAIIKVNVDQFFGIEVEEFPAQIAQVALWLTDHQMNLKVSAEFGRYFARLPLTTGPMIVHGNALQIDWETLVPPNRLSYILGNPPFSGAMVMGESQREDMAAVFADLRGSGVLDYVACWFWKAARYIQGSKIEVGFVSTNSLSQGEQVGILWQPLLQRFGVRINFAHRTFRWSNESTGVAAVHCIIIGFSTFDRSVKRLFSYESPTSEAHESKASNINPYLLDAPDVLLQNRSQPLCAVPAMRFGSMPRDGGHLILSERDRDLLLAEHPGAAKLVRPYTGAEEFLNGGRRWCLWLVGVSPSEIRSFPPILKRLELVRSYRLNSKASSTRAFAESPGLFCQLAQPESDYLLVPRVSSERRAFVPIGFVSSEVIANDQVLTVEGASLLHFGVLQSSMHMAWTRYTSGRLKSDIRYSKDIVYNNFPWPLPLDDQSRSAVEREAEALLRTRARFTGNSLADLYDPLTMPRELGRAHQQLDKAVDSAYRFRGKGNDAVRVSFLFGLYESLTSLFDSVTASKKRSRRAEPSKIMPSRQLKSASDEAPDAHPLPLYRD